MLKKLTLSLSCVVVLLTGCHTEKQKPVIRKVKTMYPLTVSGVTTRTFSGVVQTSQEISLGFRTPGQIKHIYVKEGDYVRQGQYIAELDDNDYQLQAAASRIQYDQAKKELERLEELYKRNSVSGNDYEKAKAGVEALGVQFEADMNNLSYTILKAPVSGYIQSVNNRDAEMVNAGTGIVTLLDAATIRVEAELPASLYMQQDDFKSYTCHSYLLPGKILPLRPTGINYKSNSSQLYKMYLTPVTSAPELTPGMNVEVSIEIDDPDLTKGYSIPASALFSENNKSYVWLIIQSSSTVQRREVTHGGLDASGNVIIQSGLSSIDQIVKAGVEALLENEQIQVIPEPSESNVGGLL